MPDRETLYKRAYWLAVFTVVYNIVEGVFSVGFGLDDDAMSLFGFGLDSFVEVVSGLGVWHMIVRIRNSQSDDIDVFEKRALKITGVSFFILSAGLLITGAGGLYLGHHPETTFWGMLISAISIVSMWILIILKKSTGRQLGSEAVLADAECTKTCLVLSVVLFASSLGYHLTGIGGIDSVGAIAIAIISFREGREALEKAKGGK